jgi:hypothetical protein
MEITLTTENLKELIFEQLRADLAAEIYEEKNGDQVSFLGDICLHGSSNLEIVVTAMGFVLSDEEEDPVANKIYDEYLEQVVSQEFESKAEAMPFINNYYQWLLKELGN